MAAEMQEVRYNVQPMRTAFHSMMDRNSGFINDHKDLHENMVEYGVTLCSLGKDEQNTELRGELLKLVKLKAQVEAHSRALAAVAAAYQPDPNYKETSFQELIQQHVDGDEQLKGLDPTSDKIIHDFDAATNVAPPQTQAPRELGEDEDLMIEETQGDWAKHSTCPVSMKPLLEIRVPVEDQKGFIYEKEAIEQHIRNSNHPRGAECPVHGASHFIQLRDLKPCRKLLLEQKKVARGMASMLQPATGPAPEAEEILEC